MCKMVGTCSNNSSAGTGCGLNNVATFVVSGTMPAVFSAVSGPTAATGAPVVAFVVGVSTVVGGPPPCPKRLENLGSPSTSPGQPTHQELLGFIHLQEAMLNDYSQRLSRLESKHRHLSAQVSVTKDTSCRQRHSPPHISAEREGERSPPHWQPSPRWDHQPSPQPSV
ncbi:hypothetical protein SESBI_49750 [Sesbania bispinosa]|nr:hypothetical protein SESBI_49750 [Sesbania bispinosa]